ncbi:MAG: tetratricopeptide repeat protein, partial [Verrucomicrobiota bacterium]
MISQAIRCLFFILLLAIAGCDSGPVDAADEQKDPHYLNGRALSRSQDYKGAVEEFERALESNPRNASAHFELGWLNEEQIKNYAAAIYHYEQHLRLRPDSDYAQRAKDRIRACKMDLVKNEILAPVNQGMQRDLERLAAENLLLKRQIEGLQTQLQELTRAPHSVTPLPATPLRETENNASLPPSVSVPMPMAA